MKTEIWITTEDPYKGYNENDRGYIDGYVRGGNDEPLAVVVITNAADNKHLNTLVMVPINCLRANALQQWDKERLGIKP